MFRRLSLLLIVVGLAENASAEPLQQPVILTLAEAFGLIASKPKVDLTHAFGPGTPVWAGFGQAKMTPAVDPKTLEAYTIAKDGFRATYYAMVGQYGTHVDPPAHFSATGATMDQIPLDDMMLPLIVLDDTPFLSADPAHAFSVEDLLAWEKEHGRVPKGSFAALRTDMAKDWASDPARFKRDPFPAWSLPVVKMLVEDRGVVAIGHEAMDTDATKSMESETYVLGSGHFQIEVMDNLDKVPPTGAYIVLSWPKVKNGLGVPCPRLCDPALTRLATVTTAVANIEEAKAIAHALVAARLAACVQISPVTSVYAWNEAVEEQPEWLMTCKIRADDFAQVEAAILRLHSYQLPEIVATPVGAGFQPYLDWVATSTARA